MNNIKQVGKNLPLILFVILSILITPKHEPWRDEAKNWLSVHDSSNFKEMISLVKYEGSPGLWDTILFPFAQLEFPYFTMKIIHLIIIIIVAGLFWRFSPFNKIVKVLFLFSYFPMFQYNVIARNYALVVLFLFLTAILFKDRFKSIFYPIIIFLLANTHSYGIFIAFVLFFELGLEYSFLVYQGKLVFSRKFFLIMILLLLSFSIPVMQVKPNPDFGESFHSKPTLGRFAAIPRSVMSAFIPLPELGVVQFWGSNLLQSFSIYLILIGVPLYLFSLTFFYKNIKILFIYFFSTGALFAAFLFINVGGVTHYGLIWFLFLFSLWIRYSESAETKDGSIPTKVNVFLIIILLLHVMAGTIAVYYDWNYNFSNAKDASQFLLESGLIDNQTLIAVYRSPIANSVLPYLPGDYQFYCLESGHLCRRTRGKVYNRASWTTLNQNIINFENISTKKHLLILTNFSYIDKVENPQRYEHIANFSNSITFEDYFIYQLKKE